jgi:hypothetical protein
MATRRRLTKAQITEFKERYLATYLPVVREALVAEPDPKESFEWQAIFRIAKWARERQPARTPEAIDAEAWLRRQLEGLGKDGT